MKRVKRIVTALCILFPVFLLLVCSVILVGVTDDNDDGNPKHASGLGLSDKVREYAAFVGDTAAEYNIHEYEKYLLAIMMVETGGEGNDPMQSLGNSGLTEEEKTPSESIKAAVAYFAMLLQKADTLGCDLDAVIQSYNYGAGYIDYVSVRGKAHTFQLSCDFASSKCGGRKVKYDNPVAIAQNGGWRYGYGNMFYVYLVKQYLESEPLPADTANAVLAEAYKYQGWKYVWGGSSPQTSFDCSGLTQWCFGQAGVSLPRTAQEQYEAVQHLELEEAQPGDLVFFTKTYKTDNYITHVGIYAGNGRMFHAGNPIGFADLNTNFWKEHFVCIGRVSMPST